MRKNFVCGLLSMFCVLGIFTVFAGEAVPELGPTWVNGGPYQLANVKDKLVVLYFFSEA